MNYVDIKFMYLSKLHKRNEKIKKALETQFQTTFFGESITREDLHLLGNPILSHTALTISKTLSEAIGKNCQIVRMWGVRHQPTNEPREVCWHNHLTDFSAVYYVKVTRLKNFPEGAFGILTPLPVFISPIEGLLVVFDHSVYHDAIPVLLNEEERISIALDFTIIET